MSSILTKSDESQRITSANHKCYFVNSFTFCYRKKWLAIIFDNDNVEWFTVV